MYLNTPLNSLDKTDIQIPIAKLCIELEERIIESN